MAHVREDATAGLPGAVSSVPDGMASAVLIGVNPVYGLYASFAGPVAGGLTSSTQLMVITTTTAAALAAGSALEGVAAADRPGALFLLTIISGGVVIVAGLLRLGRYTRFVSHSVMTGFLTGVSVNIVCGQLADFTGTTAEGASSLAKAVWVVTHPGEIQVASLLVGVAAMAIIVGLASTRWSTVSALVALVVPSVAVILAGADVLRVEDVGDIPRGVPLPALPDLGAFSFELVAGALAVAVIVLVQDAGVSESAPNRDGTPSDANRDFVAQGVGNVAAGFFRGQPVGGSVGQTALNQTLGARTRWAAILSGIWVVVILVAFSGMVGKVAMPILSAVLIYAAVGSLRPAEVATIWRTGSTSQVALVTTFVATLFLPVTAAVGLGVALSLLLQLNQEAMDLKVVALVARPDARMVERETPADLPSGQVTVLDVYGSLLYAGSRTLQARLPYPTGSQRPAVVLRLRGRTSLGATFFRVVADYAQRLGPRRRASLPVRSRPGVARPAPEHRAGRRFRSDPAGRRHRGGRRVDAGRGARCRGLAGRAPASVLIGFLSAACGAPAPRGGGILRILTETEDTQDASGEPDDLIEHAHAGDVQEMQAVLLGNEDGKAGRIRVTNKGGDVVGDVEGMARCELLATR
ncbi:MAG: SulP family inorganic anion transporter [Jiangellaceae bacterium]